MITYVSVMIGRQNKDVSINFRILDVAETIAVSNLRHLKFCDTYTEKEILLFLQKEVPLLKLGNSKLLGDRCTSTITFERKSLLVKASLDDCSGIAQDVLTAEIEKVMITKEMIPPLLPCFF